MTRSLLAKLLSGGLLLVGWGCVAEVSAQVFLDVVVQNRFFDRARSSPTLNVRTRDDLFVDTLLYDLQGTLVAWVEGQTASRQHQVPLGQLPPVTRGLYAFALVARSANGQRLGLYPEEPGGGDEVKVDQCTWLPEKGQIEYLLPKAAWVRVRAGLRDGVYLQQVLPWQAQAAGRHVVPWTTNAADLAIRELASHRDFQATVLALALPANLLIDQEQPGAGARPGSPPPVKVPPALADLARLPWAGLFAAARTKSRVTIADDYALTLRVEEDPRQPVVNVHVGCPEAERGRLLNQRFEIMLFLDGLFITEDEQAIVPFNYRMSTRGIPPGQHFVTVNVLDAQGVPGTASAAFTVTSKMRGAK